MTKKATHLKVYILVRGATATLGFLDMFRYDNACPSNEVQAGMLESTGNHHGGLVRWAVLARFVPYGAPKPPTVDRWKSFGWECDPRAFDEFADAESVAKIRNAEIERAIK